MQAFRMINVYIDGACTNNGRVTAKAGYGVYFAEGDPRNEFGGVSSVCGSYGSDSSDCKQTNNVGELSAFIRCLEILDEDIHQKGTQVNVYCDSEYVLKCVTTYGSKLEKQGWMSSLPKDLGCDKAPPNVELVRKAYSLYQAAKSKVTLHKIRAHTGYEDVHSKGNAGADKLANMGAGKKESDIVTHTIKLDIPFDNKDKAKELGACWDAKHKTWYVNTKFVCWQEVGEQLMALTKPATAAAPINKVLEAKVVKSSDKPKKYIKISFTNKNKAKSLGAWWDATVKSWYYVEDDLPKDKITALLQLQS